MRNDVWQWSNFVVDCSITLKNWVATAHLFLFVMCWSWTFYNSGWLLFDDGVKKVSGDFWAYVNWNDTRNWMPSREWQNVIAASADAISGIAKRAVSLLLPVIIQSRKDINIWVPTGSNWWKCEIRWPTKYQNVLYDTNQPTMGLLQLSRLCHGPNGTKNHVQHFSSLIDCTIDTETSLACRERNVGPKNLASMSFKSKYSTFTTTNARAH
jgi:hypothetical protein